MAPPPDNLSSSGQHGRADPSHIAPYLTHVVSHHGQLTLIPPQNAGRVRKAKPKTGRSERRRENPEPRFNTAAPAPSRRSHTLSGRLQRPTLPIRLPRDPDIPDEPPPPFEEAIATPVYIPPSATRLTNSSPAESSVEAASALAVQPHSFPTTPSVDPAPSSFEQQDLENSAEASALAKEESLDSQGDDSARNTLTSPASSSSNSRNTRPDPSVADSLLSREPQVSPSINTVHSLSNLRQEYLLPQPRTRERILSSPLNATRLPQVSPPPGSPHSSFPPTSQPRSAASPSNSQGVKGSTVSSETYNPHVPPARPETGFSMELVEPESSWVADLAGGLPLETRVQREFERLQSAAAESSAALACNTSEAAVAELPDASHAAGFNTIARGADRTNKSVDASGRELSAPEAPLCARCATLQPSELPDDDALRSRAQSPSSESTTTNDDEDGYGASVLEREGCVPVPSSPKSLHPLRRLFSPSKYHLPAANPNPASFSSPTSPQPTDISPWESTLTLQSSVSSSPTKKSPLRFAHAVKRKESVVFRKLFQSKGKEKEMSPTSDSTASPEDDLDSWEVVDKGLLPEETAGSGKPSPGGKENEKTKVVPQKGKERATPEPLPSKSPLRHLHPSTPAFLTRSLRHPASPTSPSHSSSFHFFPSNSSRVTLPSPDSPTGSSEQSTSIHSEPGPISGQRGERKPRRPPPPIPPRRNKPSLVQSQSPNVVWKTSPTDSLMSTASDRETDVDPPSSPISSRRPPPPPPPPVRVSTDRPSPSSVADMNSFTRPARPITYASPMVPPPPPQYVATINPSPQRVQALPSSSPVSTLSSTVSSSHHMTVPSVPSSPLTSRIPLLSVRAVSTPAVAQTTQSHTNQTLSTVASMSTPRSRARRLAPISLPPVSVYEDEYSDSPFRHVLDGSLERDPSHEIGRTPYIESSSLTSTPQQSPVPSQPTLPFSVSNSPSYTPPRTPTTPTRHYPGRPLPQPPGESSPIGRPMVIAPPSIPGTPRAINTPIGPRSLPSSSPGRHSGTIAQTQPEYSQYTELDLLVSRLEDDNHDGRNYEDLVLLSEFAGPARPSNTSPTNNPDSEPFIGLIEVARRRVTKDGRTKLKLVLLGVPVDKCGICLSQFKEAGRAGLIPICQHAFHEKCLRRWLAQNRTCPMCRATL